MYILAIIGQILFGLFWLSNAINHFMSLDMLSQYAASKRIPAPKIAVFVTGLLLLAGSLGILLGVYVWWAILALVIFIIPTTLMMHKFWSITDPQMKMAEKVNFMKNMALLGALLMLWTVSELAYSLF